MKTVLPLAIRVSECVAAAHQSPPSAMSHIPLIMPNARPAMAHARNIKMTAEAYEHLEGDEIRLMTRRKPNSRSINFRNVLNNIPL